jgi:hypothetical protein
MYTSTPANRNKWMPWRLLLMARDYKRVKGEGKGIRAHRRPTVLLPVAWPRHILSHDDPAAVIRLEYPLMKTRAGTGLESALPS